MQAALFTGAIESHQRALDRARARRITSSPAATARVRAPQREKKKLTHRCASARADTIRRPAQEIDEATKIRIVVQRDPLRVYDARPLLFWRPAASGAAARFGSLRAGRSGVRYSSLKAGPGVRIALPPAEKGDRQKPLHRDGVGSRLCPSGSDHHLRDNQSRYGHGRCCQLLRGPRSENRCAPVSGLTCQQASFPKQSGQRAMG